MIKIWNNLGHLKKHKCEILDEYLQKCSSVNNLRLSGKVYEMLRKLKVCKLGEEVPEYLRCDLHIA